MQRLSLNREKFVNFNIYEIIPHKALFEAEVRVHLSTSVASKILEHLQDDNNVQKKIDADLTYGGHLATMV